MENIRVIKHGEHYFKHADDVKVIVKDNDADGVAEAIKKYILWQKLQKYYKKTTNSLQKKIKTCIISRYVV